MVERDGGYPRMFSVRMRGFTNAWLFRLPALKDDVTEAVRSLAKTIRTHPIINEEEQL